MLSLVFDPWPIYKLGLCAAVKQHLVVVNAFCLIFVYKYYNRFYAEGSEIKKTLKEESGTDNGKLKTSC